MAEFFASVLPIAFVGILVFFYFKNANKNSKRNFMGAVKASVIAIIGGVLAIIAINVLASAIIPLNWYAYGNAIDWVLGLTKIVVFGLALKFIFDYAISDGNPFGIVTKPQEPRTHEPTDRVDHKKQAAHEKATEEYKLRGHLTKLKELAANYRKQLDNGLGAISYSTLPLVEGKGGWLGNSGFDTFLKQQLGMEVGTIGTSYQAPQISIAAEHGVASLPLAMLNRDSVNLIYAAIDMFENSGFASIENFEHVWRDLAYCGRIRCEGKYGTAAARVLQAAVDEAMGHAPLERKLAELKAAVGKFLDTTPDPEARDKVMKHMNIGAQWFNDSDIPNNLYSRNENRGLMLGISLTNKSPICYEKAPSLLTCAPSGAGKTQGQVIPALLTFSGSVFVLDIKGEIFQATAAARAAMGQNIIRWNALDSTGTFRFNPLDAINRDPDTVWEDCQEVANQMLPDHDGSQSDPIWRQEGRNNITVNLAFLLLDNPDKSINLADLLGLLSETPSRMQANLELKVIPLAERYQIPAMKNRANGIVGMIADSPKQFQGVISTVTGELSLFEGRRIANALSASDWRVEDLRKKPTTIYLSLPDKNLNTWAPILRLILSQHFNGLRDTPQEGSTALPVTFILDEAASLGNFPELLETMARGRGYGVRIWSFWQNLGQIEKVYSNPASVTENCAVRCFMNPQGETAKSVSEELGVAESIMHPNPEPLVRPDILGSPAFADYVVIMGQAQNPMKAKKIEAWKFFAGLIQEPPKLDYPA